MSKHSSARVVARSRHRLVVLLAALAAMLAAAAPATAASACGRAVIDDWSDGRIDKQYPPKCYGEAIDMLPRDLIDYSSAEEDMRRALQASRRGEPAPPNRDEALPPAAPEGPEPTTPEAPPPAPERPTESTETTVTPPEPPAGDDGDLVAAPAGDTDSASAVPIPLLILAGLALLLVAGGSAGYVVRRLQARRIPPSGA